MDAISCKGIMIFPEVCKNDTIGESFKNNQELLSRLSRKARKVLMNHKAKFTPSDETLGYPNESVINDDIRERDTHRDLHQLTAAILYRE